MKRVILLILILFVIKSSQAQQTNITIHKPTVKLSDTLLIIRSTPNYYLYKPSTENMPNHYNMIDLYKDSINLALTYAPNVFSTNDKIFFSSRPKLKALLDSLAHGK